jgi:radical SAM protein with 4Fe4S-binding SPASM domain
MHTRDEQPDLFPSSCGGQVIGAVNEAAFRLCVPIGATIEITLRCNLRCVHCYNFDRDQPRPRSARPDLAPAEILSLMSNLRREGCLFLGLTGGEVLTHPHLFDFLEHARALHLSVRLLTNGALLSEPLVARLAQYSNLAAVDLSLYGATAEVHDAITQVPGSFRNTWQGAESLRQSGVTPHLKFIVMRQNLSEVAEMIRMAEERHFEHAADFMITGRYDGTFGSLATRISENDIEPLLRGPLRSRLPTRAVEMTSETFACNCARATCAITAQGDVYPCIAVPYTAGNIREQPFGEIWRDSPVFRRIRGLRLEDYPHCHPCPHKAWCPRARGPNFLTSGDYTGVDPFVCKTAEVVHQIVGSGSLPGAGDD